MILTDDVPALGSPAAPAAAAAASFQKVWENISPWHQLLEMA